MSRFHSTKAGPASRLNTLSELSQFCQAERLHMVKRLAGVKHARRGETVKFNASQMTDAPGPVAPLPAGARVRPEPLPQVRPPATLSAASLCKAMPYLHSDFLVYEGHGISQGPAGKTGAWSGGAQSFLVPLRLWQTNSTHLKALP